MNFEKCPRCNVNYLKKGEELCSLCKKELRISEKKNAERKETICVGDVFDFDTNYALINYLMGSNLTSYRRATYKLSESYYLWFIDLDGKTRKGWKDVYKDGQIRQKYVGDRTNLPSNFGLAFKYHNRAVFQRNGRSFTFLGVFALDPDKTTIFERYFNKISDKTNLKDF